MAGVTPVKETHDDATVWEGVVHVFEIYGNPKATIAYAWSSPIEGSEKRRFFCGLASRAGYRAGGDGAGSYRR